MTTMRAAVLVDVGRIEVMDVPRVEPAPHEVLVRVQAVGLCGSDVQIVAGHGNYNLDELGRPIPLADHPQILGHEIAGVIEDVGRDVRDLVAGDRVIIDQGRTCISEHRTPACEYCITGDSHQCEDYREHGITGVPGGFAEFVTVSALNAVPLRSTLASEHAALTEPLGCILHSMELLGRAASRFRLDVAAGDRAVRTVLVCGGGPAGLLFVQHLRAVSAFDGRILLSEPNALKRSLAERWGAIAIDPSAGDITKQVMEHSSGRGAEVLIEASGAGALFRDIPGMIRKQATVLLYGHGHSGIELSAMNAVQFREPTLVSPIGASGGHDTDGRPVTYRHALRLLEEGVVEVAPMITHRYTSLEDVPRAFAGEHRRADYVKGVLIPQ
ncbi:MAG: alcohol dehydrogenase catalytic domain-containing protein [bacterium]